MPRYAVRKIFHGFFVNRLNRYAKDKRKYRMLSMQDISYFEGSLSHKPDPTYISISESETKRLPKAVKGDVVFGRTMSKAICIDDELDGCLVNSNFLLIKMNDDYSPYFLTWYINESREFRKYIVLHMQGSSLTKAISVSDFKSFNYFGFNREKEDIIGKLYELRTKRRKLQDLKQKYEDILIEKRYHSYRVDTWYEIGKGRKRK